MNQRLNPWIPLVIVVATMVIFAGSIFPYLTSKSSMPIGYFPLTTGALLIAALISWSTYHSSFQSNRRWQKTIVAAVVAIATYLEFSLFLILNVAGS